MWWEDYFVHLEQAFDKEAATEIIAGIYATDRFFDYARFNQTADYVAAQLTAAGCTRIEKIPLTADGKTRYGDWVPPRAWDVTEATLTLCGELSADRLLHRYTEMPCCLSMFSAPTPDGGVTAEVVDIDAEENPHALDLNGKILLTAGRASQVVKLAREKNAAGIITDFFPEYANVRAVSDMNGHCRWDNDFIVPVNDTGLFAFNLSPENGEVIRELLTEGSVTLHADVQARFYDGVVHSVTGIIPGEAERDAASALLYAVVKPSNASGTNNTSAKQTMARDEILLCAHLYEPGANDNASGCGTLIELAHVINQLIEQGVIKRPRRTIRFVFGYEVLGLMGYWNAHQQDVSRTLCAINADMVSAAAAEKAPLTIWRNPDVNPSFMDELLPFIFERYAAHAQTEIPFSVKRFSVGDNVLADPQFDVPTVSVIMHPALSYHSSMDDMSMVDGDVAKRNAVVIGATALFCASPDAERVAWLRSWLEEHADTANTHSETDPLKRYIAGYQAARVGRGVGLYSGELEVEQENNMRVGGAYPFNPAHYLNELHKEIPVRRAAGTLTLCGTFPPGEPPAFYPYYDYGLNCPLFWCDGKRSLSIIAVLAGTELGKTDLNAYQRELMDYFTKLVDSGYIELH